MSPLFVSRAIFAMGANHMPEKFASLQEIHVCISFYWWECCGFFCFHFKLLAGQIFMKYILLLYVVNASPYHFPFLPSLILCWFHIQGIKCFTHQKSVQLFVMIQIYHLPLDVSSLKRKETNECGHLALLQQSHNRSYNS